MLLKSWTQYACNLENSAVATGLENSVFIPISKKGNAKECSDHHTIAPISHTSKLILKILQARLSAWTKNAQMFKLDLEKAEESEINQIADICWIIEKSRELQKNFYFCFIDYAKALYCMYHNKLWKIL